MYKRILLAFDGSVEGRTALREGALLAKACAAEVHLLSVVSDSGGMAIGEGAFAGAVAQQQEIYRGVLEEGVSRLRRLGFSPSAELVIGDPAQAIGASAARIGADLVVVGHRRQSLLSRWWAGSTGAYLVDNVECSVLIARSVVSDEAFQAAQATADA